MRVNPTMNSQHNYGGSTSINAYWSVDQHVQWKNRIVLGLLVFLVIHLPLLSYSKNIFAGGINNAISGKHTSFRLS